MGLYDNYDEDQAKVAGMVFFGAAIAWKWVFVPIWGPMVLGLIGVICGVKPPQ